MSDPVFDYLTGQRRPGHDALLADFAARSASVVAALQPVRDIAYGEHPRCRFDFFAAGPAAPVVLWFHAGYWQSRDKAQFLFLAEPFVRAGIAWAAINYPLCPEQSFDAMMQAVRGSVDGVIRFAGGPVRVVVAGHSAGGHIAVELATVPGVDAVAALSGIYDLAPLLATPLNDKLGLDDAAAARHSPLLRVPPAGVPACFIVGADETPAFVAQSTAMHAAWRDAGQLLVRAGADHFTLLEALADPADPVFTAVGRLARGQPA